MIKVKSLIPSFLLILFALFSISYYYTIETKNIQDIRFEKQPADRSLWAINQKGNTVATWEKYYFQQLLVASDSVITTSFNLMIGHKKIAVQQSDLKKIESENEIVRNILNDVSGKKNHFYYISSREIKKSNLPYFNQFINWKGDGNLLIKILLHPFLLLVLAVIIGRKKISQIFNQVSTPPFIKTSLSSKWELIILMGIFLSLFSYLIVTDRYYFNQDDNYVQFTPVLLHGLNDFYTTGTIPTYNPFQAAGIPTAELGTYSFFYPLTHMAFIISKYVLQNENHFNNVFVFLHFAIGLYFTFLLLKKFNIPFLLRLIASLSFIFCGFNLETSRSWYYVAPTIAFLPYFIYFIHIHQNTKITKKNLFYVITVLCFYIYAGNFQFFVYTSLLCGMYYLLINKQVFLKKLVRVMAVFVIPILLFLPQLFMTYHAVKDLPRPGGTGAGIMGGFGGLITPFFNTVSKPSNWGADAYASYSGFFYKGAFLFLLCAFVYLIFYLVSNKKNNNLHKSAIYLMFIFGTCFLLSLGKGGLLWLVQGYLPVFNKFNHPFKFLLFVQFFGTITGAIVFQQFCKNSKVWIVSILVSFCSLLYNLFHTKDAFFVYGIKGKNDYGVLSYDSVFSKQNDFRIMTFSVGRSSSAQFNSTLICNLPTHYKIPSVFVYEPLAVVPTDFYQFYNEYGIRYFIVSKLTTKNNTFINNYGAFSTIYGHKNFPRIFDNDEVTIYENLQYEPIVQFMNDKNERLKINSLQIRNKANGISVKVHSIKNCVKIILSFRALPGIKIFINNKPSEFQKDEFDRIVIQNNTIVNRIEVRYIPKMF